MDPLHPDLARLHQRHLSQAAADHRLAAAFSTRRTPSPGRSRRAVSRLLPLLSPSRVLSLAARP